MNISRGFLVSGALYLLVGLAFGMHMGASGDHTLSPVHAHINLLGFTLMTLFGLAYRLIPAPNQDALALAHFWLHQVGTLAFLVALYLLMSGTVPEVSSGPFMPIGEGLVALGVLAWLFNIIRATR